MKSAAADARKTAAPATSSASPHRAAGVRATIILLNSAKSGLSRAGAVISVAIQLGANRFATRPRSEKGDVVLDNLCHEVLEFGRDIIRDRYTGNQF